MELNVESILRRKGFEIYSVAPDCTLYEALKLLAEKNIGALLVLDSEKIAGIFSERDFVRKAVLQGKPVRTTPVRDVMTGGVITTDIHESVENCMEAMTRHHIRHLPVLRDGLLAGIISIGDIVQAIISEQLATIQYLEKYIVGGR